MRKYLLSCKGLVMIAKSICSLKNNRRRETEYMPMNIQNKIIIKDIPGCIYDQFKTPYTSRIDTGGLTRYIKKVNHLSLMEVFSEKEVSIG